MQCFEDTYNTVHRYDHFLFASTSLTSFSYETNRLRNIARYYGHLLATDAISWEVFLVVKLTEQDTTYAILFRVFLY